MKPEPVAAGFERWTVFEKLRVANRVIAQVCEPPLEFAAELRGTRVDPHPVADLLIGPRGERNHLAIHLHQVHQGAAGIVDPPEFLKPLGTRQRLPLLMQSVQEGGGPIERRRLAVQLNLHGGFLMRETDARGALRIRRA
jgi:hypothetical protein